MIFTSTPAGRSSLIRASTVLGVGSRMSVEKDLDSAVAFMDQTAKEISEALKKSSDSMIEMETNARNLSMAVQQEYQRRQQ